MNVNIIDNWIEIITGMINNYKWLHLMLFKPCGSTWSTKLLVVEWCGNKDVELLWIWSIYVDDTTIMERYQRMNGGEMKSGKLPCIFECRIGNGTSIVRYINVSMYLSNGMNDGMLVKMKRIMWAKYIV